jgi:hypothetical protein
VPVNPERNLPAEKFHYQRWRNSYKNAGSLQTPTQRVYLKTQGVLIFFFVWFKTHDADDLANSPGFSEPPLGDNTNTQRFKGIPGRKSPQRMWLKVKTNSMGFTQMAR